MRLFSAEAAVSVRSTFLGYAATLSSVRGSPTSADLEVAGATALCEACQPYGRLGRCGNKKQVNAFTVCLIFNSN